MKSFKQFLIEALGDIVAYHGTHIRNKDFVLEHGIKPPGEGYTPDTVSLAARPDTAFGYAAMSGHGGESAWNVKTAGNKRAETTPYEDRIVFKIEIPYEWHKEHLRRILYPHSPLKEYRYQGTIPPEFITVSDKSGN
jgi:hypothetical protein